MSSTAANPVRTRRVFYVPGYDPFPARRYREIYRAEAPLQADISGYDIALKTGLEVSSGFGWRVASLIKGHPVRSEVEVLIWSDIVRESRPDSVAATYRDLFKTAWTYASTGALFRLMRLRKGPVIAALYPVAALLVQALIAFGLGWAMFRIVTTMLMEVTAQAAPVVNWAVAGTLAAIVTVAALRWFRDNDGKFYAYYLMHDFAYSASERGAYPKALDARIAEFRARVAAELDGDVDEVLVVGHSSGAHLAVSLLADLLRTRPVTASDPTLSLLTLGQVVPMVSFLPAANRLRRDLLEVSESQMLTWVDVSAPGDGCCFALCDPVAVSGVATAQKRGPLVISAAFTQSLSPERWKALRWRFFRLHFQYLCAFDQPRGYDYFQITAGPLRLAEYYRSRAPSRSRIEKPVNVFRGMM